jgi:cytidylate kinase
MLDIYGVDFTDKKNYKYIINTDGQTIAETADEIEEILEKYR